MATRYFLGGTMKQICFCAASPFVSQDWNKNDEKLLQAVEFNDADRVSSLLLRKNLVPTKLDMEGKSASHCIAPLGKTRPPSVCQQAVAAIHGSISCLEILCDFKASLNIKDQGRTSMNIHVDVLHGVVIKDGASPLMLAAKMNHSEPCRYLLHRGAAVNARDQKGRGCVIIAPDPLQMVPWAMLIQKLTQHYAPKPSCIARRHAFYWRDQAEGEPISRYMSALRNAALYCKFHDLDEALQDRLVSSMRDIRLQRRLLTRATLTLKEALDEAVTAEQSGRSTEEIQMWKTNSPRSARRAATVHREETEDIEGEEDEGDNEEDMHRMRAAAPQGDREGEHKTAHHLNKKYTINIEEVPCRLEVDTGLATTIISQATLEEIMDKKQQQKLKPSRVRLRDYQRNNIHITGSGQFFVNTALMVACENGSVETVEALIHGGARAGLIDATGHDAAHYGAATGNALIQHYLQEAAQRHSWASEEQSPDLSSQASSSRQSLCKEKINSPRKRKAPQPPTTARDSEWFLAYTGEAATAELLSKKTLNASTEELLATLQGQIECEFEKLKGQQLEAQELLKSLESNGTDGSPRKLVSAEACEQLKDDYEKQIVALKEALEKISLPDDQIRENRATERKADSEPEGKSKFNPVTREEMEELINELNETQEKYQAALAEVKILEDQIELGILSTEEKEAEESSRIELETVKAALHQTREELKERDQKMKDLEGLLRVQEERGAQNCSIEAYEEVKATLGASLDAMSQEKEVLLKRCTSAETELRELRASLEEERHEMLEGRSSVSQALQEETTKLREQLKAMMKQHEEVKGHVEELREGREKLEEELQVTKERLASQFVPRVDHEDVAEKLKATLSEAEKRLLEMKEKYTSTQTKLAELQKTTEMYRRESVPLAEHARAKEALEGTLWELKAKVKLLEQELKAKAQEASHLQAQLDEVRQGAVSTEAHEQLRATSQAEIEALKVKLSDLGCKHERTCTEVFQVQREALFMKSEKHAAEAQLAAAEKQLQSLRAESERLQELHSHIEDSAKLITDLSKEVFKLKEALKDLSELSSGTSPKGIFLPKAESELDVAAFQRTIKDLEQQLIVSIIQRKERRIKKRLKENLSDAIAISSLCTEDTFSMLSRWVAQVAIPDCELEIFQCGDKGRSPTSQNFWLNAEEYFQMFMISSYFFPLSVPHRATWMKMSKESSSRF
ncbi:hypothetical protein E2320_022107 [Naja naja]|nr:hypothetical protein E2320_022107 [Naja naja]